MILKTLRIDTIVKHNQRCYSDESCEVIFFCFANPCHFSSARSIVYFTCGRCIVCHTQLKVCRTKVFCVSVFRRTEFIFFAEAITHSFVHLVASSPGVMTRMNTKRLQSAKCEIAFEANWRSTMSIWCRFETKHSKFHSILIRSTSWPQSAIFWISIGNNQINSTSIQICCAFLAKSIDCNMQYCRHHCCVQFIFWLFCGYDIQMFRIVLGELHTVTTPITCVCIWDSKLSFQTLFVSNKLCISHQQETRKRMKYEIDAIPMPPHDSTSARAAALSVR